MHHRISDTASTIGSTALPIFLAVGLQLQVVLPIGVVGIKASPADAAAAAAAVLFLARGQWKILASMKEIAVLLAAATAVLTFSLADGYIHLGRLSTWAFGAKYVGWFLLLAFFASGMWITQIAASRRFTIAFAAACAATALVTSFIALVFAGTGWFPRWLSLTPLRGLADNRNAFSFLILAALAAVLADGARTQRAFAAAFPVITGVLMLSLLYAGSRAAIVAGAGMIAASLWVHLITWRGLGLSAAVSLASYMVFIGARALIPGVEAGLPAIYGSPASSDLERWTGIRMALAAWSEHPVLGVGLGQFVELQASQGQAPMIIHNTVLWLLTEAGFVGAVIFIALGAAMVRRLWMRGLPPGETRAICLAALFMFGAFVVISQVHELLYQRVLWLFLGMALGSGGAGSAGDPQNRSDIFPVMRGSKP